MSNKENNYAKNQRGNPPAKHKNNYNNQYEVNSYSNSMTYRSYYYFGCDIFDIYNREQIESIIRDPMANNEIVRELSLLLYGMNGVYTNTVDYMTAIPTLDRVIVPHGENKKRKYKNKSLMDSTLRTIKDKEIVRDALMKGMIEGACYYYFETTKKPRTNKKYLTDFDVNYISEINELGINASIFCLPAKYTKIVGIKNNSYVIAFNLDYFSENRSLEPIDNAIKKFPKEIRDAYQRPDKKDRNWVILNNDNTIVHKIRSKREEQFGRPLVLAAINDILYDNYFTETKRNVLDEMNNKIVYQTFPEGRDKGTSGLTGKQQTAQHEAVKSAIMNKNGRNKTSFFSVAAGTKIDTVDPCNTEIFDSKYESNLKDNISLDMGIAGSLLNGTSSGSYSSQENNLRLLTAQIFQWIEQISAELNKCIMKNIIKDTKNWVEVKYLPTTYVNKSEMVGFAKDLYLQGKGSLSFWVAACGVSPDTFFALLDQEVEEDFENKYPVHMTSYTASDKKGGRPKTDNPTENTIKSRNSNGNATPSPSDN